MQGIVRLGVAVPALSLGDVRENTRRTLEKINEAAQKHVGLIVFPELGLTGYTLGDLFFQNSLLQEAEQAVAELADACPAGITAVVGLPIRVLGGVYNAAAVISRGMIHTVVPKQFLPNHSEFYEKRWFRSLDSLPEGATVRLGGREVPVGSPVLFSRDGVGFGVEICEDLWSPLGRGLLLCLRGAELMLNLSASNEIVAKHRFRESMVLMESAKAICAYAYVSSGAGESTTDLIFSGQGMIACCGSMVNETQDFLADDYLLTADIDLDRIRAGRRRQTSFSDACDHAPEAAVMQLPVDLLLPDDVPFEGHVKKLPFIPSDKSQRAERCSQIFAMQAAALSRRLGVTGGKVVLGISGGLDSTLALLAACAAVDRMGLPRTNILGITMPAFGTSDHTYQNALALMTSLGISQKEIPIHESVRLHFRDIGHEESDHSVVYENAQARERTQVLMDVANQFGGIVLGTGDLSEIALGWCTYNADHMSMYGINAGIPKTLVRWIIQTVTEDPAFAASHAVLQSILDTPISPELLPPDENGAITQQTEDLVGPYALHDFFLYHCVRFGRSPKKLFELSCIAFAEDFDRATILKWLKNFYRRFFNQQFKRSCMPDGVKIGSISLSPRGDWRMPSDATARLWLEECEQLQA